MKAFTRVRALRDALMGVEPAVGRSTTEDVWYDVGAASDEIEWSAIREIKLRTLSDVRNKW